MNQPLKDCITQPDHYVKGRCIEPLEVIEAWGLNYHTGNILKYIARASRKNCEKTDLEKALLHAENFLSMCSKKTLEVQVKKPVNEHTKSTFICPDRVSLEWGLDKNLEIVLRSLYMSTVHSPAYFIEEVSIDLKERLKQLKTIARQNTSNESSKGKFKRVSK